MTLSPGDKKYIRKKSYLTKSKIDLSTVVNYENLQIIQTTPRVSLFLLLRDARFGR